MIKITMIDVENLIIEIEKYERLCGKSTVKITPTGN